MAEEKIYSQTNVPKLLQDPEFIALSFDNKKKVLNAIGPGFENLTEGEYEIFRNEILNPQQKEVTPTQVSSSIMPAATTKTPPKDLATERLLGGMGGTYLGGLLGGFLGGPPGAVVGGLLGGSGTDYAIRRAHNENPAIQVPFGEIGQFEPGYVSGAVDIGTGMASQEMLSKFLRGAYGAGRGAINAFREWKTPGSVVPLPEQGVTYSQYKPPGERKYSEFIENYLAPGAKKANQRQAEADALKKIEAELYAQTGQKVDLTAPLEREAQSVQSELGQNFLQSIRESTAQGEAAKVGARANTKDYNVVVTPEKIEKIPGKTEQVDTGLLDEDGNPIMKTVKTRAKTVKTPAKTVTVSVEGPIHPLETNNVIRDINENVSKGVIDPDAASKLLRVVDRVKTKYANGHLPLDFEEAWQIKKDLQEYAATHYKDKVNFLGSYYNKLTNALDNDIENSIQHIWDKDPRAAAASLDNYLTSKRMAGMRTSSFADEVNTVRLQKDEDLWPVVNNVIDDSKKLQNALNAGDLDILTKNKAGDVVSIQGTNTRRTLQNYQIKRLLQSSSTVDPQTGARVASNPDQLFKNWEQFKLTDSARILYSNEARNNITNIFRNLSKTAGQTPMERPYLWIQATRGTIGLGTGLLAHMLGSGPAYGTLAAAGGYTGAIIGGQQFGKLLNNSRAAAVLEAASRGGPLGMSQKLASRVIGKALTGESIQVLMKDGSTRNGKVDSDGQIQLD